MLQKRTPTFDRLLSHIEGLPIIDAHEHMMGPEYLQRFGEPIAMLIAGYVSHDLLSAGLDDQGLDFLGRRY